MTRNRILSDIITERREHVARLRLKGLSYREIGAALALLPEPITDIDGHPLNASVICRDMAAIRREWRKQYAQALDDHIARQLAEIALIKRQAFTSNDADLALKCIALEMKLLGTDAPAKFEDWTERDWRSYAREHGLDESEVIAEARRIVNGTEAGRRPLLEAGSDRQNELDPKDVHASD